MYYYNIYGVLIVSDLFFPQLVVSEDTTRYDAIIEKTELSEEIQRVLS